MMMLVSNTLVLYLLILLLSYYLKETDLPNCFWSVKTLVLVEDHNRSARIK